MSNPNGFTGYWPDGSGQYTEDAQSCFAVTRDITDGVLRALENVPFSKGDGPFTICEYGAADGGTTVPLIIKCIKSIKERFGEEQEIHVIYNDLPTNDFKSLFMRTNGLIPGATTYTEYPNVFVSAVGTSFYSQVMPSNTLHFGFSSTSLLFLSKRPGPLDDAILHFLCPNEEQSRSFSDQAATDLEVMLLHRAAEMKAGGRFVVACACSPAGGLMAAFTQYVKTPVFQHLMECWKEFEYQNKITKQESDSLQMDIYFRNKAEFRAAFRTDGPVHDAGLRLTSYNEQEWRCVHHSHWNSDKNTDAIGAKRSYARAFVRDMRRSFNWSLMSALDPGRPESERKSIADALFESYEDKVAAAPEEHSSDLVLACLLIRKLETNFCRL